MPPFLSAFCPIPLCWAGSFTGAYLAQTPTEEGFKLSITAQFWVPSVDTKGFLRVSLPELELTQQQELAFSGSSLTSNELHKVEVKSEFAIDKSTVQLWWPAGGNYGPHKLYDIDLTYTPDGTTCSDAPAAARGEAPQQQQQLPVEEKLPPRDQAVDKPPAMHADASRVRLANPDVLVQEPSSPEEAVAALDFADVDQQEAQQLKASALSEKGAKQHQHQRQQQRQLLAEDSIKHMDAQASAYEATAVTEPVRGVAAAAALKDLLSVISDRLNKDKPAATADSAVSIAATPAARVAAAAAEQPTAPAPAPAGSSSSQQCSSIRKRIGFRTVELVMQPLPQAVQELFGNRRGFDFTVPKQKVLGILARDGAGQWANNKDGEWSHFPGDDIEVGVLTTKGSLICRASTTKQLP